MYEELMKIRNALEKLAKGNSGILKNFPKGCCGYSSNLIATYLEEHGLGTFNYIEAKKNKCIDSHAWLLSQDGYVIDLTADQFGLEPIIYIKDVHPLLNDFPIQRSMGNANIFKGLKLDSSYYFDYEKILRFISNEDLIKQVR